MPKKVTGTSFVGGSNLVVFKDSPNKDAAWAFVKFMADPANQVAWYEEATVLPAVQSAWDDPALADDANVAVFGDTAPGHEGSAGHPDLERGRDRDQRQSENGHDRGRRSRGRGESDGGGSHRDRHGPVVMAQRADPVGPPRSTGSVREPAAAPALTGAMGAVSRRREPRVSLRQHLTGWGFALPFVLIFLVFMAGPLLASLVLSLTDFGLRDLRNPLGTNFIGLENYVELLGDTTFHKALVNTAYFVVVGVPLTLGIGLAVALALDRGIRRFRTVYRVGYYLPVVTSIVADRRRLAIRAQPRLRAAQHDARRDRGRRPELARSMRSSPCRPSS